MANFTAFPSIILCVNEKDAKKEALEQVEKATESESAKREDLVKSEDRKRKLVDVKKRITDENTSRPRS